MKAEFNEQVALMIKAENNTERVALFAWYREYDPHTEEGGKSCLVFEFDEYLMTQPCTSNA